MVRTHAPARSTRSRTSATAFTRRARAGGTRRLTGCGVATRFQKGLRRAIHDRAATRHWWLSPGGPMRGYVTNIDRATISNDDFRRVLFTGPNTQLVVMTLGAGEDIGLETHAGHDQFI